MKRNIIFGSILAAALSVGVAAQSGSSAQSPSTAAEARTNQMLTVTGCLQAAGAPSATGTSGSATSASKSSSSADASKADDFMLMSASQSSAGSAMGHASGANTGSSSTSPSSSSPATRGTSGSSTMGTPSTQYQLTGGDKDQLRRYANSKVEIHGQIDTHANAGTSPQTSAGVDKGTDGQHDERRRAPAADERCDRDAAHRVDPPGCVKLQSLTGCEMLKGKWEMFFSRTFPISHCPFPKASRPPPNASSHPHKSPLFDPPRFPAPTPALT